MKPKIKTYLRCPWASICGRSVHRKRGRVLCRECARFVKAYSTAGALKDQRGAGDEAYATLKAERVAVYAERASNKLPLFDAA